MTTNGVKPAFVWLILAGGQGRRMGFKDKGWVQFEGEYLIERAIRKCQAQASKLGLFIPIVISANQHIERYASLGSCVVQDEHQPQFNGPLAGVLSVMKHSPVQAQQHWLTWPVDSPNMPIDYLVQMLSASSAHGTALAEDTHSQQKHYTHLAIPPENKESLTTYLASGKKSIKGYLESINEQVFVSTFTDESAVWLNLNDAPPKI